MFVATLKLNNINKLTGKVAHVVAGVEWVQNRDWDRVGTPLLQKFIVAAATEDTVTDAVIAVTNKDVYVFATIDLAAIGVKYDAYDIEKLWKEAKQRATKVSADKSHIPALASDLITTCTTTTNDRFMVRMLWQTAGLEVPVDAIVKEGE